MQAQPSSKIRVVVADDHPLLRRGVCSSLEAEGVSVVSEAGDGEAALAAIKKLEPDVAVLDITMPKLDGFGVIRKLNETGSKTKVIFLTLHAEEDFFDAAMELGAKGYLLKDSALEEVAVAVRSVAAGGSYLSSALTFRLIEQRKLPKLPEAGGRLSVLTPSERQILRLIATGLSSKEIAEQLGIHYRTVENHRTNMCRKLGLEGANALVRFALQSGTELDVLKKNSRI